MLDKNTFHIPTIRRRSCTVIIQQHQQRREPHQYKWPLTADVLGLNKPINPGCLVNSEEKPINQNQKTHVIINLLLRCYIPK